MADKVTKYDVDNLFAKLIAPIDRARSSTTTTGKIESRINAFYRMIGFPVVKSGIEFFSPGYDLGLNTSKAAIDNRKLITDSILNNNEYTLLLSSREYIPNHYSKVFSDSGFSASAIALGSSIIRSFDGQFSGENPLKPDSKQFQKNKDRIEALKKFYNIDPDEQPEASSDMDKLLSSGLLSSSHLLKPFVVDPRIGIFPDTKLVSAPFPKDASSIKSSNGSYLRPYIERVISLRLDTKKPIAPGFNISDIIANIKKDNNIVDKTLLNLANNADSQSENSDLAVFLKYIIILKSLVDSLIDNINTVNTSIAHTNFQPIPNPTSGVEGGFSINKVVPDKNNKEIENNILEINNIIAYNNLTSEVNSSDMGEFEFSQIDDLVFSAEKAAVSSDAQDLKTLGENRNTIISEGTEALRKIELIMGEFSGLGLIDVVAIQAALWTIDTDILLGLIDEYAYKRLGNFRPNIGAATSRNGDVLTCLTTYESKLSDIYTLVQLYYNGVYSGINNGSK